MICTNCGTQFEDNAKFCPNCGATLPQAVPAQVPVPVAPEYGYAPQPQPVIATPPLGNPEEAKSCMIMGILAAAFSCTFVASFMGIIFGIIGMAKANGYVKKYNVYTAKVRVGKYCSIGGLAFGIFATVLTLFYIGIIVMVISSGAKRWN